MRLARLRMPIAAEIWYEKFSPSYTLRVDTIVNVQEYTNGEAHISIGELSVHLNKYQKHAYLEFLDETSET